jgi:prepilin signal peptidase PulO-like enzyme (type II secretory pathway)
MAEGLPFALWCLLWSVGFVTFVIDLEHFLILDKVTFWGTVLVFVLLAIFSLVPGKGPQVLSTTIFTAAIGVLVGPLPFLVLWYVSKGRWLGFGDVKFMVFLGALLGSPLVFLAQLFAFWVGTLVAIPLLLWKGKTLKTKLPFGTFLVLGSVVAFLWGRFILSWYMGLVV